MRHRYPCDNVPRDMGLVRVHLHPSWELEEGGVWFPFATGTCITYLNSTFNIDVLLV